MQIDLDIDGVRPFVQTTREPEEPGLGEVAEASVLIRVPVLLEQFAEFDRTRCLPPRSPLGGAPPKYREARSCSIERVSGNAP
jgi:hypothetical protein